MKVFAAVFVLVAAVACIASAGSSYGGGGSSGGSYGGSSGGGGSIPAPPCPKNYIISCQPSLNVAPCAPSSSGGYGGSSSGGYGSSGAYSENIPTYFGGPLNYHVAAGYLPNYNLQGYQY